MTFYWVKTAMAIDVNAGGAVARGAIRSGNFDLGYVVEGAGTPTLVIGSSVYYPRVFSARLRERLRMAFVDHRGFAKPTGLVGSGDFALETVLDDIELARRQLGLGKVVVLGHSGHGYMALEYAKRRPEAVAGLVMVGVGLSHAAAHMAMAERRWDEAVCPERKARFAADMARLPEAIAAAPDQRFVAFCAAMGARRWFDWSFDETPLWDGVHVNMDAIDHLWGEVFRDIDVAAGLDRLTAPTLLVSGRFDYSVAPHYAWDAYRDGFADLTVRVFDRSGHTPQMEESDAFDAVLLEWLATKRIAG